MENSTHKSSQGERHIRYDRHRVGHTNQRSTPSRFPRTGFGFSKYPVDRPKSGRSEVGQLDNPYSYGTRKNSRVWWTHVWSGLVRDPSGKHYMKLKTAVWLYLYLLLGANWRSGKLFRRVATIAKDMAIPDRTITRWLKVLRDGDYIESTTKRHVLQISIKRWRPVTRGKTALQEPRQ